VSLSTEVPVAMLNSQSQISLFRNSTLSIAGDGYTSNCGVKSRSYLIYSWSVFQNNAAIAVSSASLQSVSVNPLEFKLPSYRLSVGSLYRVQLTVKHSRSLKMSSSSVEVFVQSGGGVVPCLSVLGYEDKTTRPQETILISMLHLRCDHGLDDIMQLLLGKFKGLLDLHHDQEEL
jgi:hypothetical protein